jgi:hypothetical protein
MVIFYVRVPLLYIEYLNKGTVWEAEIFGIFLAHLELRTGKVSLKSVTSIEHVGSHFGRPYRAMAPREPESGMYFIWKINS